jgi:hypothetical protein
VTDLRFGAQVAVVVRAGLFELDGRVGDVEVVEQVMRDRLAG